MSFDAEFSTGTRADIRWLGVLAFTLASAFAAEAHAGTDRTCYPASADRDGDGYAVNGTAAVTRNVDGINCPSGYVNRIGDCNDSNSWVHPRQREDSVNRTDGIDDDCDGRVDEPEIVHPEGNIEAWTTTSGFYVPVRLNAAVVTNLVFGRVFATVAYRNLSYDDAWRVAPQFAVEPSAVHQDIWLYAAWVDPTGDLPSDVFQSYVTFYNQNNVPIATSDTYYVALEPDATPKKNVAWARFHMANRGLRDVIRSYRGEIGYRGQFGVDGTSYGADKNRMWCSEFYAKTADHRLRSIGGNETVSDLTSYFKGNSIIPLWSNSWFEPPIADRSGFRSLKSGDYVAMDTNEDGKKNHSGMVLTYDERNDVLHLIEGNSGNEVKINRRPLNATLRGYGLVRTEMLD